MYIPYLMNWPININLTDIVAFRVNKVQKKIYMYRYIKGIFVSGVWMEKKPVSKFFDLCPWITYKVYLEGFPLFSCPFPTSKVNYEKCPLPADRKSDWALFNETLISISPWPCVAWWTNQVTENQIGSCKLLATFANTEIWTPKSQMILTF